MREDDERRQQQMPRHTYTDAEEQSVATSMRS